MSGNGECKVIKIGRKGLRTFGFGECGDFTIDVIVTYNKYLDMRRLFADEKNEVPQERLAELSKSTWDFVRSVAVGASKNEKYFGVPDGPTDLTAAESQEFITHITNEVIDLQRFFEVRLPQKQSSPESTELRFST